MTTLRLRSVTVYFRILNGAPEMLIEHGCDDGAATVTGEAELKKIADSIHAILEKQGANK